MTLKASESPYTGSYVGIEPGVTVKAEPGVVIKVAELNVQGTLDVEGTAEKPVVFTSPFGESPGEWAGLIFEPGSGGSVVDHAEVKFGGFSTPGGGILIKGASPTIEHSTIRKNVYGGIKVTKGGSPEIAHNFVTENGSGYPEISYSWGGYGGEVNIHDNQIEGGYSGISVEAGEGVTSKSLAGNTVIGTTGEAAISYLGPDIPDISENTLTENAHDEIGLGGTVAHSMAWSNVGAIHLIRDLIVPKGSTLNVGAGTYFRVGSIWVSAEVNVSGTLNVEGTAEEPVVFTSFAEESPGEWKGLVFEPGSGGSVIDHAEVKYGGFYTPGGAVSIKGASPTIEHSTIRKNVYGGIKVTKGGSPEIADNHLTENGSGYTEIFYSGGGYSGEVNIHDNLIEGGNSGIYVEAGEEVVSKSLIGNTVIGTTGEAAISYYGPDIPNITENTLTANTYNEINVRGSVAHSMTWNNAAAPIHLIGALVITKGITLNVGAGTYFRIGNGWTQSEVNVSGTLNVEGTTEEPVIFNSYAEEPSAVWRGIIFEPGSGGSVLDHAEVKYGGFGTPGGGILIRGASPTIEHSTIRKNVYGGIRVVHGGSPEIAHNVVTENGSGYPGILYFETNGNSGEVNIHDNYLAGGESGISVYAGEGVGSKSLAGNTVVGTTGEAAISYSGEDIPNVTENTLLENAHDRVDVTGKVSRSMSWSMPEGTVRMTGIEPVVITAGKTLSLDAGMRVEVGQGPVRPSGIYVIGTLNVEGTVEEPVLFTSPEESAPGQWGRITFVAGSGASTLEHAELRSGGGAAYGYAVQIEGSSPTIRHSTFRENTSGIRVKAGAPSIEWNRFRSNGAGLTYEGEGKLVAPNNDWGCASGPAPAGCGDSVAGNVDFKPFVQLPEDDAHCRGKDSQCGEGADPVSLATGQLAYSHRDLLLTNKSAMPLEFSRSYGSGSAADTGLGRGWSQTGLASATEFESGAVLILRSDGRQDLFYKVGVEYKAPSGVTDSLAKVEGTFHLTTIEGTVYAFDASGRIASITDDHGLATTFAYNENGRLATITDPSAQTLTFSYNGSNHMTAVRDSTGREVEFAYTEAGDLKTVTDALGGVTEYEYDSGHRIKTITDPRKNVILKNTYDGQGRIVEQRDGLNNLWKLEYKAGETIVTEPEGGKNTYGFDGQDRVVSEKDQLGQITTTGYDEAGNVDEVIRPGGAKWKFGHDPAGNLSSVLDPEGGERSYEYDGKNHLTEFTDARSKTWEYEWSEENLEKVTDPEEGETTFEYDPAGKPIAVVDANEGKSEFSYDARGNLESATDPLEHKTTFEYDARNHLIERTVPGLKPEIFERNAYGDLLSRTSPEGRETEYAYDPNGVLEEVIDPAEAVWTIKNNAMERPIEYVDPLEQTTEIEYDGNLNPVLLVDRRGRETTYGYDPANHLSEIHRPEGGDWEFSYDARGNRESALDPRGNETTYEYDLLDRMTDVDEPLGVSTHYEYDPASNLVSVKDPRENETTYEYDDLGRLEEIDQPLGKTTSFGYDPLGNLLARTTAEGTLEYGYDQANRLREVSAGETLLRSFDYDDANRLTDATGPKGDEIEIGYDDDGLPTSIDDGRGQSLSRDYDSRGNLIEQVDPRGTLEYKYDELGRLSGLIDPSGAFGFEYDSEGDLTDVERSNGVTTHNAYDNAGRLESIVSKLGEATLESLQYEYDPAGNRKAQVDRLSQETTYEHDALNRLTEFNPPGEGSTKYDYDPAGNRIEAGALTYEFNALNQLTEASDGTVYNYDEDGRLAEVQKGEEATTYEWDPFDNLAKVEGPGGTAEYAYDALERPIERTDGSGTRETHYGDLTDLPSYDTDSEGELTTGYVRGAGGLVEQTTEAPSYPLADAHGDVVALTSEGGGVSSRQSYDPWGTQLSGPNLEMGYLGAYERRSDPTSGLVQMGARSYDSALGTFLSEDPVLGHFGRSMSVNRYLYVWDNPLNYYDLNGRETCVSTPLGSVCPVEKIEEVIGGAETAWHGVEEAGNEIGSSGEYVWNKTAPARHFIADRAQDFWKKYGSPLESAYEFAGENWQTCLQGGSAGAVIGFYGGTAVLPVVGSGAGAAIGGGLGCAGLVGARIGTRALFE